MNNNNKINSFFNQTYEYKILARYTGKKRKKRDGKHVNILEYKVISELKDPRRVTYQYSQVADYIRAIYFAALHYKLNAAVTMTIHKEKEYRDLTNYRDDVLKRVSNFKKGGESALEKNFFRSAFIEILIRKSKVIFYRDFSKFNNERISFNSFKVLDFEQKTTEEQFKESFDKLKLYYLGFLNYYYLRNNRCQRLKKRIQDEIRLSTFKYKFVENLENLKNISFYQEIYEHLEKQTKLLKENEFHWVSVLEFTPTSGTPHFHMLVGPGFLNSFMLPNFKPLEVEYDFFKQHIYHTDYLNPEDYKKNAKYVCKYLGSDYFATKEKLDETEQKASIVSSSLVHYSTNATILADIKKYLTGSFEGSSWFEPKFNDTLYKVVEIIRRTLNINKIYIDERTKIFERLITSPLEEFKLITALEYEFDVSLCDEFKDFLTVGDIADFIKVTSKKKERPLTYYFSSIKSFSYKDIQDEIDKITNEVKKEKNPITIFLDDYKNQIELFAHQRRELRKKFENDYRAANKAKRKSVRKKYDSDVDLLEKEINNISLKYANFFIDVILSEKPVHHDFERDNNLSDEQDKIYDVLNERRMFIIDGGAGTGKSHSIISVLNSLKLSNKIKVLGTARTSNATEELKKKFNNVKMKNYNIEFLFENYYKYLQAGNNTYFLDPHLYPFLFDPDYVILDEAGMCSIQEATLLLGYVARNPKTRLIILGDLKQLPPVGSDVSILSIAEKYTDVVVLTNNWRNQDEYYKKIFEEVRDNNYKTFMERVKYVDSLESIEFDENVQFLSLQNGTRIKISEIYQNRYKKGKKEKLFSFDEMDYYIGDKIMITQNNSNLRLYNGEEGHLVGTKVEYIKHRLKNSEIKKMKDTKAKGEEVPEYYFKPWTYAVAAFDGEEKNIPLDGNISLSRSLTVHKSQGGEFDDKVFLILEEPKVKKMFNSNLIYTAITRARKDFEVYVIENDSNRGWFEELMSDIKYVDYSDKINIDEEMYNKWLINFFKRFNKENRVLDDEDDIKGFMFDYKLEESSSKIKEWTFYSFELVERTEKVTSYEWIKFFYI